ncbi:MAG: TonB-dependent receptor [Pseudomonadota bacterium]
MQRSFPVLVCILVSALVLPPPARAQSADPGYDEEIVVVGRAQTFYLQSDTRLGAKIDLDVVDLPQSVQILTKQLIIDQAARDITDLYRSIAGVSEFSYSGVTFRGFRDSGNVFYDGVRGDPYSGFSVPQLFNIERVEVLKGPSAALYGSGEPGGMINYVTKKPRFETTRDFAATAGNYSLYGASADATGALAENVAYRVGAFYESQDSFRRNADETNLEVATGVLWRLGDATELTASVNYVEQELGGHRLRGVLADDDGDFIVGRSFNTNESSDFQDLQALVGQLNLKHDFSETLQVSATLRYLDNEREQGYHEPRGWVDANGDGDANQADGTIRREYRDQFRANEETSLTIDVTKDFTFNDMAHTFLAGADYHVVDTEYDYLRARYAADGVVDLNVYDRNYGITNPATYNLTDLNRDGVEVRRYGFYVQDYVRLNEAWAVMLGVRYDDFEDEDKSDGYSFSDDHLSPRLGITFRPAANTTFYLNYSESFKPASLGAQEDVEGDSALDPERGTQWELGWKQQWLEGQLLSTVAVYQIVKEDLALTNPLDTGPGDGQPELINLGEVESQGAEFTLVGDLTQNWTMTANYAWNDTEVVEGSSIRNTFGDGSEFVNAPEHQVGLWTRYDFDRLNSSIAFGVDYVSEQRSFNDQMVKAYTTVDASWTTSWERITLQINATNLFDKEYAVSGFLERTGHFPGAPREIVAQLRYQF